MAPGRHLDIRSECRRRFHGAHPLAVIRSLPPRRTVMREPQRRGDVQMRSFLIVANQTLASPTLASAVEDRAAEGPARCHAVVPPTPVQRRLTWDEPEAATAARGRRPTQLASLR